MAEWGPKIQEMAQQAEQVYLFASNHWQGQTVDTQSSLGLAARQLRMLLGVRAVPGNRQEQVQ
ncbi:MAG: hypothetical protein KJ734_02665, partial [Chloroflexi bacterium]|nr:hypothetical protein [Chloroflexota bacterium]